MNIKILNLKTSLSVITRVFLWFIMLIEGSIYSIVKDLEDPLFNSLFFHIISFIFGYILLILSFRAAANGGRELKKGRIGDIPRLETNRLVTTGIYSCLRHPMLFGLTLLPLAIAFLEGSPTFITKVAPLEMIFIIFMVIVFEEMEVKRKFKDEYEEYKSKVPLISFNIKCLKMMFRKIKQP